jgi:hypothetical protein
MSFDQNRRRHQRLAMDEHAVAIAANGVEIGTVIQAGGGGMTIESGAAEQAKKFKIGERMRITVVEPGSQTRNTIDAVLRHCVGTQLGFEFVSGAEK